MKRIRSRGIVIYSYKEHRHQANIIAGGYSYYVALDGAIPAAKHNNGGAWDSRNPFYNVHV
ncbi:hypothetical protein D3C77_701930 [compost metagenome]